MHRKSWTGAFALTCAAVVAWMVGGCGTGAIQIPVNIPLGSTGTLDTTAGTPKVQGGTFSTGEIPITIGSGSLGLDPSAISFTPGSSAKVAQVSPTCSDACALAGVDATTCSNVCEAGEIEATIWIGLLDEVDTVCDTGDMYGPYRVTLDDQGQATNVDPSSVTFQSKTLAAFNAGGGSFCVSVITPDDGTVVIDELAGTVGL